MLQLFADFFRGHGPAVFPVSVFQKRAVMLKKQPAVHGIGRCIHIKGHADGLAAACVRAAQLHYDGGGKITVSHILVFIVLADIHHTPEIFDQTAVRIIRGSLVKEATPVGIRIEQNLQGIDHGGFPAPGMPGKKVNPLPEAQDLPVYVMPVVQAQPGQCFKSLLLHDLLFLPLPSLFPVCRILFLIPSPSARDRAAVL